MFIVQPIEDKQIQKELCAVCETLFIPEDFAYLAANVNEDGSKITGILGICQFTVDKNGGVFHTVKPIPGGFDEEVMIIMVRTAMSFLYRIDVHTAMIANGALTGCPEGFIQKISFQAGEDRIYRIDLDKFFASPCRFQADAAKDIK